MNPPETTWERPSSTPGTPRMSPHHKSSLPAGTTKSHFRPNLKLKWLRGLWTHPGSHGWAKQPLRHSEHTHFLWLISSTASTAVLRPPVSFCGLLLWQHVKHGKLEGFVTFFLLPKAVLQSDIWWWTSAYFYLHPNTFHWHASVWLTAFLPDSGLFVCLISIELHNSTCTKLRFSEWCTS